MFGSTFRSGNGTPRGPLGSYIKLCDACEREKEGEREREARAWTIVSVGQRTDDVFFPDFYFDKLFKLQLVA